MPRMLRGGWTRELYSGTWAELNPYPEYVTDLGVETTSAVVKQSLNTQLTKRVKRLEKTSEMSAVVKALTLSKGTVENHLMVYAAEKTPKPFSSEFIMSINKVLRSPIYDLPVCVPEMVMAVLTEGCSQAFLCHVRELMTMNHQISFIDGVFIFDVYIFWQMYLRRSAMEIAREQSQPTQTVQGQVWMSHNWCHAEVDDIQQGSLMADNNMYRHIFNNCECCDHISHQKMH